MHCKRTVARGPAGVSGRLVSKVVKPALEDWMEFK